MSSFWKNKKVFITGHTGFKGSWLSFWLTSLGAKVYGYSLEPSTKDNLFKILNIKDLIQLSEIGDICDMSNLKNSICNAQPQILFHLAAQPLVRISYDEPIETLSTNIIGTANVLESMRYCSSLRSSVMITSDKCYENKERYESYSENDPMGGYDPYSVSKGCSELIVSSYRQSFFSEEAYPFHKNAIASARAGNVIGGGDWSTDRLVPDAIKSFKEGKTLSIRNPTAVRPWQHVLEPLNGYMSLAQNLYTDGFLYASGWNFGPDDSDNISVQDIVNLIIENWPNDVSWKTNESKIKHEANLLKLNCDKAKSLLGWKPIWSASKAIEKTILWHSALSANKDMYEFSLSQINEYNQEYKKING